MKNDSEQNIAISYYIDEIDEKNNNEEFDIHNFLENMENDSLADDFTLSKMLNYNENCTVKELLLICDFYGITKQFKNCKFKKEEIINFLVYFESDPNNNDIVSKRQTMWFYISQLKNDKFMKKYVLW